MSDILDIVLRDEENIATETVPITMEDSIAHYGRLGMKWYQHIYGEYQGAAKYAEKGARRVDRLQERGNISAAKRLRKKVDKFLSIAEKEKSMSDETKRKIAESINEHSSDKEVRAAAEKIKRFEETSKASDDIIDELRQDRINDLTRGVADWKNASSEDISAAITRLNLEKQYKEIRDDVSGAKVWKEAGVKALNSVAGSSGKILEEVVKTAGNIAEEKNKADIAAQKDARTWAREDEKYERDRKDKLEAQTREDRQHERDRQEKLEDQAREDRNAELKGQRDVAKEEAKNRADYLTAQQKVREYEDEQKDSSVRDVLEGRRPESSLTPKQAEYMQAYVENVYGKGTTAKQVIDKYETDRQQARKRAADEAEAKAQREFNEQYMKSVYTENKARQQKRDTNEEMAERELARRQAEFDTAKQRRAAAEEAQKKAEADRKKAEAREKRAAAKEEKARAEKAAQDEAKQRQYLEKIAQGQDRAIEAAKQRRAVAEAASANDNLSRNLSEIRSLTVDNAKIAEAVNTGSSLVDKWLKTSVRHSAVPVFRRMSREEYRANYSGLKWKRS